MPRLAAALFAALIPGFAGAQVWVPGLFRVVDAKAEKDKVQWTEYKTVPVQKTVEVTVEKNGVLVTEKRTVTVYETQAVTAAHELKTIKATDAAGKEIAADKLAELLKESTPVVVTTGPIAEKHRALFKDKVIFVALPGPMPPK